MQNAPGPYIVEIATSDFTSTQNAIAGGADRIELCANLGEGGTTQSIGVIRKLRESYGVKLYPIIRLRGGDFLYSQEEFECMQADAIACKELGCDGVVVGFLNRDGSIDTQRTAAIVESVYPLGVTFHRAFDRCLDPEKALEQLIEIGCERILTSGQQPTAPQGMELIAALNQQAAGRIIIMPGSGVHPDNVRQLRDRTGCREFHASMREPEPSRMDFFPPAFQGHAENDHFTVQAAAVRKLKAQLL